MFTWRSRHFYCKAVNMNTHCNLISHRTLCVCVCVCARMHACLWFIQRQLNYAKIQSIVSVSHVLMHCIVYSVINIKNTVSKHTWSQLSPVHMHAMCTLMRTRQRAKTKAERSFFHTLLSSSVQPARFSIDVLEEDGRGRTETSFLSLLIFPLEN